MGNYTIQIGLGHPQPTPPGPIEVNSTLQFSSAILTGQNTVKAGDQIKVIVVPEPPQHVLPPQHWQESTAIMGLLIAAYNTDLKTSEYFAAVEGCQMVETSGYGTLPYSTNPIVFLHTSGDFTYRVIKSPSVSTMFSTRYMMYSPKAGVWCVESNFTVDAGS